MLPFSFCWLLFGSVLFASESPEMGITEREKMGSTRMGMCFLITTLEIRIFTPWKINMEPTNPPFRKENDFPNLQKIMFHVNLQDFYWSNQNIMVHGPKISKIHQLHHEAFGFLRYGLSVAGGYSNRTMSLLSMRYMGVMNPSMKWQLVPQPNRIIGFVLLFCGSDFQLMVNWWFGLVIWDSRGTPK